MDPFTEIVTTTAADLMGALIQDYGIAHFPVSKRIGLVHLPSEELVSTYNFDKVPTLPLSELFKDLLKFDLKNMEAKEANSN